MTTTGERTLFEKTSVPKAIVRLALPTVVGQIILVVYNMADTFFVGLTGNDSMITAVTVCMPAFMFLSAISNLFGIGGASVIARALGRDDSESVKSTAAFALWGCVGVTLFYSFSVFLLRDPFLDLLGGSEPTVHSNASEYLSCTVIAGGCITSVSMLLSHLIRSEGRAVPASVGIALGGILNILFDPLFMFVLLPHGREAFGAAIATTLSNFISLLYFSAVLLKNRRNSQLRFYLRPPLFHSRIPLDVLSAGLPACIMTLFENISYAVLDKLMSFWGLPMQTGIGVAKKVNMLSHCIVRGIAQGSLPLIGYSFSAKNFSRMRCAVRVSHFAAVGTGVVCMLINLIYAGPLIGIFIHTDSLSHTYGSVFLRILCIGGPFSASAYTYISFFQAVGEGRKSFFLAILRKGIIDIPLMLFFHVVFPVYGIVFATPIADILCCIAANILFQFYLRGLNPNRDRLPDTHSDLT